MPDRSDDGRGSTGVDVTAPVLLRFSRELLVFVVHALREHQKTYTRNGWKMPDGVTGLVESLVSGVSEGQPVSSDAVMAAPPQSVVMSPRLATYDDAAQMCRVSLSTIKRVIRDGELTPVAVGGLSTKRLRITDIDEWLARGGSRCDNNEQEDTAC